MDDLSELMLKAQGGDLESLRLLLLRHQRNLRLFAAVFMPGLADVDRVVRATSVAAARAIKDAPGGEALGGWLRGLARAQIAAELERLDGQALGSGDPLVRLLVTSGRERLASVPEDVDPEPQLCRRLQMMPKGALDLLVQRFGRGLSLARLAEQRGLGVDDLAIALQTACRQLDWSADAFGGAGLDSAHYHALDAVLGGDPTADADGLRRQVLDDMGLAMRAGRDARTHLIAAAWHAPEFALEARELVPAGRRTTNTRRIPTPGDGSQAARPAAPRPAAGAPKPTSAGTRRIAQGSRRGAAAEQSFEQQQERAARRARTVTIATFTLAGLLIAAGVLALVLRGRAGGAPPARPPVAATSAAPAVVAPVATPAVTPAAANARPEGDRGALFGSGPGALPAPLVAYSVRRLVGAYGGPLVRVRRASDNAERDIPATSAGALDTAELTLFVGKGDGRVVRWYDQSGAGHHLAQPAPETQPLIVRGGTLEIENGRPVLGFDRTRFQHLTTPGAVQAGTLFALVRHAGGGNGAQGIIGSRSAEGTEVDAYYPIVDRDRNGKGEWWIGMRDQHDMLQFPLPAGRLLLWQSATDGTNQPTITMHLDGKEVAGKRLKRPGLAAIGPTVVGGLYWRHMLVDPFGGSLGEVIMLPPAIAPEAAAAITANLKAWWRLP